MTYLRLDRAALLIFALALCVRVLFALPGFTASDTTAPFAYFDGYYEIAENLVAGNGFSRSQAEPFMPDSVRTPLYPLIVAGVVFVTGSYNMFMLFQIVVGSIIPLLGRKLAEMMTGQSSLALGVGIFLALEPFGAWVSIAILTETFFTFFFLLGCIALFSFLQDKKTTPIILAAILLGCATLVKPTTQLLPLLFCAIVLFKEWRPSAALLKQLAAFLVVFYLILSPWMLRNYVTFGTTELNSQLASSLFSYLVPSAISLESGKPFEETYKAFHAEQGVGSIEEINLGNAAEFQSRAMNILREHPVGLLKSLVITSVTFFTHDGYRTFTDFYSLLSFDTSVTAADIIRSPQKALSLLSAPGIILIAAGRALWILVSVFGLIGLYLWVRARRFSADALFVAVTIAYFAATTAIIGLGVNGRLRFPISAFLVTLALFACVRIISSIRTRFISPPIS